MYYMLHSEYDISSAISWSEYQGVGGRAGDTAVDTISKKGSWDQHYYQLSILKVYLSDWSGRPKGTPPISLSQFYQQGKQIPRGNQ